MSSSPWRQLAEQAAEIDELAAQARFLAQTVATARTASAEEYQGVMTQAQIARELAAATARLLHATEALQVETAALVESSGLARQDTMASTRSWLARHQGLAPNHAGMLVRAAETVDRFPTVKAAYVAGEMTLGHLNSIGGIIPSRLRGDDLAHAIDMVTSVQDVLVDQARRSTVEEFRRFCVEVRKRLDTDGTVEKAKEPSRLSFRELMNGRGLMTIDFSSLDWPVVMSLLSDAVARRLAAAKAAGEPDPLSYSEMMAAELAALLFAGASSDQPGRIGLFVHIDVDDLDLDHTDLDHTDHDLAELLDTNRAHTEAGFDLDDDTLWNLMFDAQVTPIYNRNGTPLSYGRDRRLAPFALRRFLAHRDRRCRFPGCDTPPNRQRIHHLTWWNHGGTTDGCTCIGFCNRNHHDHHDRGYTITGDPNGHITVTRPNGTIIDPTPAYTLAH